MRTGQTIVIVRVDEIDAETLQPLQTLFRRVIGSQRGADLSIIKRHRGEVDTLAVEIKIAAIDPKLAKPETLRPARIQDGTSTVQQRHLERAHVLGGVGVPEAIRDPVGCKCNASLIKVCGLKGRSS